MPVYLQAPSTLRIVFRRTPQTERRMAAVPDAIYSAAGRCWFAPLDSLGALLNQFPKAKYDCASAETAAREMLRLGSDEHGAPQKNEN